MSRRRARSKPRRRVGAAHGDRRFCEGSEWPLSVALKLLPSLHYVPAKNSVGFVRMPQAWAAAAFVANRGSGGSPCTSVQTRPVAPRLDPQARHMRRRAKVEPCPRPDGGFRNPVEFQPLSGGPRSFPVRPFASPRSAHTTSIGLGACRPISATLPRRFASSATR